VSERPIVTATLTTGSVPRHLATLTVPMVWGVFAMITFNVVDTWFVAQLGEPELAAMSFTFPVVMVLISLGIGLMAGTSSVMARAIGANESERVKRLCTDATLVAIALSLVLSIAGLLTIDPLFSLFGAGETIRPLVREYMEVWYLGFLFLLVPMVGFGGLRSVGDSRLQGTIYVAAAVANVMLDPLLIFGLGSFEGLGLRGAALATLVARAGTLVAAYVALSRKHHLFSFARPTLGQLWRSSRDLFHVGLPAAGTNMIVPAATAVVIALLAGYGQSAVAAFGAATRVEAVTLVPFYALSAIIGPFVGQNLGAGEHGRIAESLRITSLFCLAFGVASAILLAVGADFLMGLFTHEPRVREIGRLYLWMVPLSNGTYGIVMVVNASFNGLGRPIPGVAISMIRMGILYVPLAWAGSQLVGVPGVFAGAAIANLLAGAVAYVWLARGRQALIVSEQAQA
jgi:putative MATE family efflux protein